MHELSIAMSIVELVEEESARQGDARVLAVHLKLGPLSGVVKQALLASFETACEGTALDGCTLIIEEIPIEIDCKHCHATRPVVSIQEMRCSICGGPADKVIHGRELEVSALEITGEK
jgi:hydrogenase nickel incorporation protein HypA/HybF